MMMRTFTKHVSALAVMMVLALGFATDAFSQSNYLYVLERDGATVGGCTTPATACTIDHALREAITGNELPNDTLLVQVRRVGGTAILPNVTLNTGNQVNFGVYVGTDPDTVKGHVEFSRKR